MFLYRRSYAGRTFLSDSGRCYSFEFWLNLLSDGPPMEVCHDCTYAKPLGQPCPNPACWPGLHEYIEACKAYALRRAQWVTSKHVPGVYYQTSALAHQYERGVESPPKRSDFERTA